MSESDYQWVFSKLPTWQILELEEAGIPLNFNIDDLTEEQRFTITFIDIMRKAIDAGKVEVLINDREVRYKSIKKPEHRKKA